MSHLLKNKLEQAYSHYAQSSFIENDPISIPHSYSQLQDIEIAGFFAAIFSWGRRDIIIAKSNELLSLMQNRPHEFILNYSPSDIHHIQSFKHRTFNVSDLDFYLRAFQQHYKKHASLESAFLPKNALKQPTIEFHLAYFYNYLKELVPSEKRNLKHISTPQSGSACKRLCMFLRWMVRRDEVDLGLWKKIHTHQLIMPLDVHVIRIAMQLGLIEDTDKPNWKTACKLTDKLKLLHPQDPTKYDLALFSLGVNNENE